MLDRREFLGAGLAAAPLLLGALPRAVAGGAAPRVLVTADAESHVAVVDLVSARVLRRVEVGAGARHLGLHPEGHTLWVALGSSAAQVVVLSLRPDPARPRVIGQVRAPFLVHDVAFSPSGRRVWLTAGPSRGSPSSARAHAGRCAC